MILVKQAFLDFPIEQPILMMNAYATATLWSGSHTNNLTCKLNESTGKQNQRYGQ